MSDTAPTKPSMADIGVAQDQVRNLRRQLAKHRYYTVGNRWHFSGSALAIALALVSPVVLLVWPNEGPLLGAVAGVWVFASRLIFDPIKKAYQLKGATAQEMFDCDVLGLPWNASLTRRLADEDIRSASKAATDPGTLERHKRWYPTDTDLSWPASVLTCQRSNAVWGRRQHRSYGWLLVVAAGLWILAGIVLALVRSVSLAEYLTTVALPSLPAVLDATELAKKHFEAAANRQSLEDQLSPMLSSKDVEVADLREIQDQVFGLRRDAPPVAGWFYRVIRSNYESDMRYAANPQHAD